MILYRFCAQFPRLHRIGSETVTSEDQPLENTHLGQYRGASWGPFGRDGSNLAIRLSRNVELEESWLPEFRVWQGNRLQRDCEGWLSPRDHADSKTLLIVFVWIMYLVEQSKYQSVRSWSLRSFEKADLCGDLLVFFKTENPLHTREKQYQSRYSQGKVLPLLTMYELFRQDYHPGMLS